MGLVRSVKSQNKRAGERKICRRPTVGSLEEESPDLGVATCDSPWRGGRVEFATSRQRRHIANPLTEPCVQVFRTRLFNKTLSAYYANYGISFVDFLYLPLSVEEVSLIPSVLLLVPSLCSY